MQRRTFVLSTVAGILAAQCSNAQEAGKLYQVGFLHLGGPPLPSFELLVRTLRDLGWIEGKNIQFEPRYAKGKIDQLPALVAELVSRRVDLIFAVSNAAAFASKQATSTIPIVFSASHGAVETGLVASLRRPGGNMTGTESLAPELDAKRIQLLHETLPKAARFVVISNPLDQGTPLHNKWSGDSAKKLGIRLENVSLRHPNDLESALAAITKIAPDGILLMTDSITYALRKQIVGYALAKRLPLVSEFSYYTELGGLLSYGPRFESLFTRAADYVDKILKGAKAGELPVEQPTELELAVNIRTAKALRITIPPTVMALATKIVE